MIFNENRLLTDDSHEISYEIAYLELSFILKIRKDVTEFVVSCYRDWRFKVFTKTCSKVFPVSKSLFPQDIVILDNESLFHETIRLICQNINGVHEKRQLYP